MKIKDIEKINHPDFRVFVFYDERQVVFEAVLKPKHGSDKTTHIKNLSVTLVTNTPEDGVLGVLEHHWLEANLLTNHISNVN